MLQSERDPCDDVAMVRALGAAISATCGVLIAMIVAAASAERRQVERGGVIDDHALREALAREGEVARQAGMALSAEGEGTLSLRGSRGAWSLPVRIAASECVAVVVGSSGRQRVQSVAVQALARAPDVIAEDAMSVGSNGGGLVAHTQWCERASAERRLVAVSESVIDHGASLPSTHRLRWAVYRGPWSRVGGLTGLSRGRFRPESIEAFGDDLALAEAQPRIPRGEDLAPPIAIQMGFARLIPSDVGTYGALVRASMMNENPRVNPRVDTALVPGVRWNSGLPVNFGAVRAEAGVDLTAANHDPVVDLGLNDFRRVLAVIDRSRLGGGCVSAAFVRHRLGYLARAEAIDADGTRVSLSEQGNVTVDARCSTRGPTVYLAPFSDHDRWTVRLLRTSAPISP